MNKFYSTVAAADTTQRRHLYSDSNICVTAQSWDGSVMTELFYEDDTLMIEVSVDMRGNSNTPRYPIWCGPFKEYIAVLAEENCEQDIHWMGDQDELG